MTVKLIVDASQVRDRMALPDHGDVNTALDSILPAAHLVFQSILQTKFESVTGQQDVFCVNMYFYPVLDGHYRCRLKQGFVKQSPTPVVEISRTRTEGYTTLDLTKHWIDYEKGVVYVDQATVEDLGSPVWVRVTYSAGFDATNKPPDWLIEGILGYVPAILNDQQTTNRSDEATNQYTDNLKLAETLLGPYLRGSAFHFRPMVR